MVRVSSLVFLIFCTPLVAAALETHADRTATFYASSDDRPADSATMSQLQESPKIEAQVPCKPVCMVLHEQLLKCYKACDETLTGIACDLHTSEMIVQVSANADLTYKASAPPSAQPGVPAAVALHGKAVCIEHTIVVREPHSHNEPESTAHVDKQARTLGAPASQPERSSSAPFRKKWIPRRVASHAPRPNIKPFVFRSNRREVPYDTYLAAILNPAMNSAFVPFTAFPEGGPAKFGSDPRHWQESTAKDSVQEEGQVLDLASHLSANSSHKSTADAANVCLLSSAPAHDQNSHAAQLNNKAALQPTGTLGICLLGDKPSAVLINSSVSLALHPSCEVAPDANTSSVAAFAEAPAEVVASAFRVRNGMCWVEGRQHGNMTSPLTGKDVAFYTSRNCRA